MCDSNIPSKKVILKNGGKVDIESYKTKEGTSSSHIIDLEIKEKTKTNILLISIYKNI